jgi:hypothetical protein
MTTWPLKKYLALTAGRVALTAPCLSTTRVVLEQLRECERRVLSQATSRDFQTRRFVLKAFRGTDEI